MIRKRHKKVKTYDGISEFAISLSYRGEYIYIHAYNIIQVRENSWWQPKRNSFVILAVGKDGLNMELSDYRAGKLHIERDYRGHICIDGVDFT